jgi:hypothetical protein
VANTRTGNFSDGGTTTRTDRRRPGRLSSIAPELVPLLRNPDSFEIDETDYETESDGLGPARGVAIGLALVTPFWILVGFGIWWYLKG